jgi:pimeloyl-ACP methyl ester carboxylesterase
MWPKRNTAFVIIHGSGSHRPFEALDKFARGFWNVLRDSNPALECSWQHRLLRRRDWVEHYVSLAPEGQPKLDLFEYYWDCYVDRQIGLRHVIEWLEQVSNSAKRFYATRPELALAHQKKGSDLFQDGDFKVGGYFIHFGWVGRTLRWLQRVGIARIPIVSTVIAVLLQHLSSQMADLMGDAVVYTTADARSKNYAIRQRMLDGAVEEVGLLSERDDYDQIILVGHSLGSLIAYDALNRIIEDMNTGNGIRPQHAHKLVGLVTFGSPLDKVAFFFRDHTRADEFVRRQILAHQHGFRRRPFPGEENLISIDSPMKHRLNGTRWLNFYHLEDPVSGHLDAYDVNENILCDAPVKGAMEAHRVYWTYDAMFQTIGARFFQGRLGEYLAEACTRSGRL